MRIECVRHPLTGAAMWYVRLADGLAVGPFHSWYEAHQALGRFAA